MDRESPDGHGLRVLVVDDDADTRDSLAFLLRLDGHHIQMVSDGAAALHAVEAYEPDVVLLDIGLPGVDGYMIAERLRDRVAAKKPFLIAITGYGTIGHRRRSAEAGIHLHLVKPVDPSMLAKILERFHRAISTLRAV
jgi:CheY-like chemotaxis protein